MTTAIVLFTRDLRVHDHPALDAACRRASTVVPVFVLDQGILASRYAAPNRLAFLSRSLDDLRSSLRERGGDLLIRRGDPVEEVAALAREVGAEELHLSADVSAYAARRRTGLDALARDGGLRVEHHPGVTVVDPFALATTGGGGYLVFTPYWRRWVEAPVRRELAAPADVPTPAHLDPGSLPSGQELGLARSSPDLLPGGERQARRRADAWLAEGVADYDDGRDRMGTAGTSLLSADLHLGTLSPVALVARLDRRRRGHEAFARQVCWRDFNHQLLAAHPDLPRRDLRTKHDDWVDDQDALEAWRQGMTGYPLVDAGMRQLRREGWMHNRARMITASFLTKHLYVDWRVGAWHFMDWLVDGDLANNFAQWQWMAGTGADSRPNRMFNPVTQGRRHDPHGDYVRRYVPELAEVEDRVVHAPWDAHDTLLAPDGYPPPIVDHRDARARFLAARGA